MRLCFDHAGVTCVRSTDIKDQLVLTGNDLNSVSQSAAQVQQKCRVCDKVLYSSISLCSACLSLYFSLGLGFSPLLRSVSLSRPVVFAVSSFQDIRKFLDGIYVSEKGNVVKE